MTTLVRLVNIDCPDFKYTYKDIDSLTRNVFNPSPSSAFLAATVNYMKTVESTRTVFISDKLRFLRTAQRMLGQKAFMLEVNLMYKNAMQQINDFNKRSGVLLTNDTMFCNYFDTFFGSDLYIVLSNSTSNILDLVMYFPRVTFLYSENIDMLKDLTTDVIARLSLDTNIRLDTSILEFKARQVRKVVEEIA